jgi:hypothetical protein
MNIKDKFSPLWKRDIHKTCNKYKITCKILNILEKAIQKIKI